MSDCDEENYYRNFRNVFGLPEFKNRKAYKQNTDEKRTEKLMMKGQ